MKQSMKKWLLICMTMVMMAVTLVGCGEMPEDEAAQEQTASPETTTEPTATPEVEVSQAPTEAPTQQLSAFAVHFIDVGQGDSILLQSKTETMLIDAGNNKDGAAVVQYLKNEGITSLDYVVGTHPDADHIGGLDVVIENLDVKHVWMPRKEHTTKTYEDVLLAVQAKGLKIKAPTPGETISLGDAVITVIGPSREYTSNNDNSIVLRVEHGVNSFLLTGDAELEAEETMLSEGMNLSATVLKVGHHGSHSSSSRDFLEAVSPMYAVICCGVDNSYGHPHIETKNALDDADAIIYRTDIQQTIIMSSDGMTLDITTGHPSAIGGSSSYSGSNTTTTAPTEAPTETPIETPTETQTTGTYIGNINSKKFHIESCSTLPNEENRVYFSTREEAINQSYDPCGRCNP